VSGGRAVIVKLPGRSLIERQNVKEHRSANSPRRAASLSASRIRWHSSSTWRTNSLSRNMLTPDGVSSPLPSRLPESIDALIIENDGKTMSPVRREWMHLARHELIGRSVTN
jgi:hypothetical protein